MVATRSLGEMDYNIAMHPSSLQETILVLLCRVTRISIQNFSLFSLVSCAHHVIANAPLTSMLKTSDPIIYSYLVIGSSAMNKSLQLCFQDLLIYHFATKSIQNDQNLKLSVDLSHKIWE